MKKNEFVDLSSIDTVTACNKGAEFELRHPATNEPLGIFWTVLGADSDVFRDYMKESLNARMRKEAMAKKRGRPLEVDTLEDAEQKTIDLLTACSVGWRSGEHQTIKFKGEDLPFNVPNARKVLTDMRWIRLQVDDAIGDLENFMKS